MTMREMTITARTEKNPPKYEKTAAALLARCREFYQNPENEKEFLEWRKNRNEKI